ncbi:MAG: hypothetical protein KBC67_02135 [Candidatus Pacebacteria bacterium]|nr:hypothetical protein [Candidatus Paceibacterota bacterium]
MVLSTWGETFATSLQALWAGFISFVPGLILAIIIFIIGWIIGSVVGKAIMQLFAALKIDKVFESAGAGDVMARAGMRLNVGKFLGDLVKWFIVAVFLMTALNVLQLTEVTTFLRDVVLQYLPRVIVAALVLVMATVISDFMRKFIRGSAKMANVRSANLLGSIAHWAIWIFAIIIALAQLGIAAQFMQILFTGIIAMLAIAGGLAFGLGGRDAAAHAISNIRENTSMKK